jgi:ATP-dependent helicase Lhr and Lhr-like helicase
MTPESPPNAFGRLHATLQEALYRMQWTKLRPIQVDAIHEVFDGTGDLIIAARTAAGKTEAAFLPILSRMLAEPSRGVRAVYVGPLKALINDQFSRLEELCREAEIPVHKWHGDVAAAPKRRFLEHPSGVLLITPESIESLFVNHSHRLPEVFAALSYIVIDELHSFIGTERGAHLRSLISRLGAKSRESVRRAGLSATFGDDKAAVCRWLRPAAPESVRIIESTAEQKSIQLKIYGHFKFPDPGGSEKEVAPESFTPSAADLEHAVFEAFYGKTALIFINVKSEIEQIADYARRISERRGMPNLFRVHYGSLSKSEREETEAALKSTHATATFCSSTLEMGIDVGNVKLVGQIGPPWSVSSLSQRLGRSGRKEGEASIIRIHIEEDEPEQHTSLFYRLFLGLLQATAMTRLMLEKWCEPPNADRFHLSTLIQQILSVIKERGGAHAESLHRTLVLEGGFPGVDHNTLIRLLRCMGAADLLEQAPDGLLITGLRGEKIIAHHSFYVAFVVEEEYRVNHESHHIGNVGFVPDLEEEGFLILTGRRWKIIDIDHDRKTILVKPSTGGRVPRFFSGPGGDIHPRVREVMRELLEQNDLPVYLDPTARDMLTQARATARDSGVLRNPFLQDGLDTIWFTWTGSRTQRTLWALGKLSGISTIHDEDIALVFEKIPVARVQEIYRGFLSNCPDAVSLARQFPYRVVEKYDRYLSDDLTAEMFARERMDLPAALEEIRTSIPHPTSESLSQS